MRLWNTGATIVTAGGVVVVCGADAIFLATYPSGIGLSTMQTFVTKAARAPLILYMPWTNRRHPPMPVELVLVEGTTWVCSLAMNMSFLVLFFKTKQNQKKKKKGRGEGFGAVEVVSRLYGQFPLKAIFFVNHWELIFLM